MKMDLQEITKLINKKAEELGMGWLILTQYSNGLSRVESPARTVLFESYQNEQQLIDWLQKPDDKPTCK